MIRRVRLDRCRIIVGGAGVVDGRIDMMVTIQRRVFTTFLKGFIGVVNVKRIVRWQIYVLIVKEV